MSGMRVGMGRENNDRTYSIMAFGWDGTAVKLEDGRRNKGNNDGFM